MEFSLENHTHMMLWDTPKKINPQEKTEPSPFFNP